MIQTYTRLKAADNTGARQIMCVNVMGGSGRKFAGVGDIIVCSVKKATPAASVKKGDVVRAVVIRSATPYRRSDGTYIRFDDNAAVILGEKKQPQRDTSIWAGCPGNKRCAIYQDYISGA